MPEAKNWKVLLFIGTERIVGRQVLEGIVQYSNLNGPWEFYGPLPFYAAPRTKKALIEDIHDWSPDGAIMIEHEKEDPFEAVLNLGIPAILSYVSRPMDSHYPSILTDNAAVGEMGANHFLERGFRNYAFCGCKGMEWSQNRLKAFFNIIANAGYAYDYFEYDSSQDHFSWERQHRHLKKWLLALRKPVALMACNDDYARDVLDTCKSLGIAVPDEIAVLGADNDQLICGICTPSLSSININFKQSGYDAACTLDMMMTGRKTIRQNIYSKPTHVETRASTDIIAIEDEAVAAAVRFIRQNALKSIQVQDVAEACYISRRTLQKRFRSLVGHSIHHEIRKVRVNQLAEMMTNSNLPLSKIMRNYDLYDRHISRQFKLEKGMTPSEYRKKLSP